MTCHNCSGNLEKVVADLPFKIRLNSTVIVKNLPILQCQNCNEYLIEDPIMMEVDTLLANVDKTAEVEILSYSVH